MYGKVAGKVGLYVKKGASPAFAKAARMSISGWPTGQSGRALAGAVGMQGGMLALIGFTVL
jgi:hypothetical protein